jgi:predicted lipoprotein with Yx(FWY)xxD motif
MFALSARTLAPIVAGAALLIATVGGTAHAFSSVAVSVSSADGHSILVDDAGKTLYRYTLDQGSTSTCYGGCAVAWPPVLVDSVPAVSNPALAAGLGVTPRDDGSTQLTYGGQPLYYFIDDVNPGDVSGQANGGVWFTVDAPVGG